MEKTHRQNSIVSYAGLNKAQLLSLAKELLAQRDEDMALRFSAFLPLFPFELIQNMDYAAADPRMLRLYPSGFSTGSAEYHLKLYHQMPELYTEANYARNFDYEGRFTGKGVFTVDKAWALHFPQYQPFMGEKLCIYLIGGGPQAVAVPESVYPRGAGFLRALEQRLQITQRAQQYLHYVRNRTSGGESYDPEAFTEEYLAITGLKPTLITQSELARTLQDLTIAQSLKTSDTSSHGLFTENAKRAEHLRQYVPCHYACDTFSPAPVTRHTARLAQPCFEGADYISDLWIPYQDLNSYVDKQCMALDIARLCEGYQIAPVYDPETGGGRYPDSLRVAVVRDREVPMMTGDVLGNPAYGSGMNPLGMIGKQVFIPDSRELIRQRKLCLEKVDLTVESAQVSQADYIRQTTLASLQETKGALVDALYRREAALSQIAEGTNAYEKAHKLLNQKVTALEREMAEQSGAHRNSQVSGYDADIDYLRRKYYDRVGLPDEDAREPIPFETDAQREQSIEGGYAMRSNVHRMRYVDAALPVEDEEEEGLPAPEEMPEAEPESEAESESEAHADLKDEKETEADIEAKIETETETKTEAETQAEAEAQTEAQIEADTETQTETKTEAETQAEADAETETDAEIESEGEAIAEALAEEAPTDEPALEPEPEPSVPIPHSPATFSAIRAQKAKQPAGPGLSKIAPKEADLKAPLVQKGGKMASLVKKKHPR